MKNKEIASAIVGATFFALPYLALSIPIIPSLALGGTAFVAGQLVFKDNSKQKLKVNNLSLYKKLEKAKKERSHIFNMISKIEDEEIKTNLNEICMTTSKIISTIEVKPKKEKKLDNFFEYYLPVTVKLVDRLDEIENQRIVSNESKKFNESTKNMIIKINDVFKKFLNNLYKSDMLDTDIEIKVLNSMLKSDGLDNESIKVKEDNHE